MAKEDDLKKIELKVTVDCCDGCKKKVLKALSIKGVLKMEIHPTLPRVTVTGNVDAGTLIKRLAKCGKVAEELPLEDKKQDKGDKKPENNKEEKAKDGKCDKKGVCEQEKSSKCCEENKSNKVEKKADGEKADKSANAVDSCRGNTGGKQTEEVTKNVNPMVTTTMTTTAAAAVAAPLPQLNYTINPAMMQGAVYTQASLPRVYYPMDPHMLPASYPQANTYPAPATMVPPNAYPPNMYPAAATAIPPPYYVNCCHDPLHHHSPAQSLPPRLTDYFNDDNTASCLVM